MNKNLGVDSTHMWEESMSKLQRLYDLLNTGHKVDDTEIRLLQIESILAVAQEISSANIHNHTVNAGDGRLVPESTVVTIHK